jgi:spermidine/putrescine transport system permease protein
MTDLARVYGWPLTILIVVLASAWVIGMIVVPQLFMVEESLWTQQRSTNVGLKIDKLYADLSTVRFDRQDAQGDKAKQLDEKIAGLKTEIDRLEKQEKNPPKVYTVANYTRMSALHFRIFVKTLGYAALVTLLALVVCYPIAYTVAQIATPNKSALLMLGLIIPYAINELLRVYAWLMILDYKGVINSALDWLGIVNLQAKGWIPFLEHPGAVFVAMVYAYILFMVFPIYNTIETLDRNQIEAARDLGASTLRIHRRVVIPHAKPGIAVGCIMTFMLSAGSYSVPQIMTRGKSGDWFSQTIYRQFFESFNWHIGAAYSFTLLLACIAFIFLMMAIFKVGIRDIAK